MKVKSRLLLAVVAGMLAASTVGVAAQESESGASFFEVTTLPGGEPSEPTPGASGPGWESYLGAVDGSIALDAGDARASGLLDQVRNHTQIALPDAELNIERSSVRLVNDQGSWVGEGMHAVRFPQGPPSHVAARWHFEGEDAYEGLILELHSPRFNPEHEQVMWGVIYPAEAIPPAPEAIAAE